MLEDTPALEGVVEIDAGKCLNIKSTVGKRGLRIWTGQKAEPVGLKLTLFLSGHEYSKACSKEMALGREKREINSQSFN